MKRKKRKSRKPRKDRKKKAALLRKWGLSNSDHKFSKSMFACALILIFWFVYNLFSYLDNNCIFNRTKKICGKEAEEFLFFYLILTIPFIILSIPPIQLVKKNKQ